MPWTALVETLGASRFEEIRRVLGDAKTEALDRDAFLLNGTVGQLFRDLMPKDAPTESVNAYGALLHMLYLHWERDWPVARIEAQALDRALQSPAALPARTPPVSVCYLQLPERVVWAASQPGGPHEPLDGQFVVAAPARVRVLAVLGFRPERVGFTTMESDLALPAAAPGPRADGSAPFASVIPGGERAELRSVADAHELAALAVLALGTTAG